MAGEPAAPSDGYCDCGGIDARNHISGPWLYPWERRVLESPAFAPQPDKAPSGMQSTTTVTA
jgi:hypothetical protein